MPGKNFKFNDLKNEKLLIGCLIVGVLLIVAGFGIQGYIADSFMLDDDFDLEFESQGKSTFINKDYLFPYNPMYKTTGVGTVEDNYTTVKTTRIVGLSEEDKYVSYSYNTTIQQPTFMIDMNRGDAPGDDILNMSIVGGSPDMPFPFEPHRPANTIMHLDKKEWSYYTKAYKENETQKTGYARSVFTHDLEKKSYPIWIGPISGTVDAWFISEVSVKGIDGYMYGYNYTFEMVLARDNASNPVSTLVLTEKTVEVHEPDLGILLHIGTNISYSIEVRAGPQTIVIPLYSEVSSFEIDDDDEEDISKAVKMVAWTRRLSYALPIVGVVTIAIGFAWVYKKRKNLPAPPSQPDDNDNPEHK